METYVNLSFDQDQYQLTIPSFQPMSATARVRVRVKLRILVALS